MSAARKRDESPEDEEDSVALGDSGYVGTSPEYQNFANVGEQPLQSEDANIRAKEDAANATAKSLARQVNPTNPALSYDPGTVHPSEKTKPQDKYIEGNRAIMNAAVEAASNKDDNTKSSPLGS